MFQVGHRVIRRNDDAEEIGNVIGVIPDDRNSSEYTLYDVEFASGRQTLHGYELRSIWAGRSSCIESDQLSLTFKQAFDIYYNAVSALANAAGTMAHMEFDFLLDRAEEARKLCKLARERMQQHKTGHGCVW